jgi:hypothetical protein
MLLAQIHGALHTQHAVVALTRALTSLHMMHRVETADPTSVVKHQFGKPSFQAALNLPFLDSHACSHPWSFAHTMLSLR